ncbi:iporin-like isoform X1, partial [Clarias magur]
VIAEYYHPWAFLAWSQDPSCKSLFQEFLLLLQPLSELPFDLHLLSESRLQRRTEQNLSQSRFFALSGCSFLRMPNWQNSDGQLERSTLKAKKEPCISSQTEIRSTNMDKILHSCAVSISKPSTRELELKSDCLKKKHAGWWLSQTPITERIMEADCSDTVPRLQNDETLVEKGERTRADEAKPSMELRWARLFGSGIGIPAAVEKAQRSIKQNEKI